MLLKVQTPDREGIKSGPASTSYFKRISLRPPCVAHTHTHAGAWTSVAVFYRLFCRPKRIATSNIWINRMLSFSRIMSPRGFAFPTQSFSTGRVSSAFKEPNRSRLVNEKLKKISNCSFVFFYKYRTVDFILYEEILSYCEILQIYAVDLAILLFVSCSALPASE